MGQSSVISKRVVPLLLAAVAGQTTTARNLSYIISKGTTSIISKQVSYLIFP